jgi:hypothetical protein
VVTPIKRDPKNYNGKRSSGMDVVKSMQKLLIKDPLRIAAEKAEGIMQVEVDTASKKFKRIIRN